MSGMRKVELTVKNEKTASYRLITTAALIIHLLFFSFFLFFPRWFYFAIAALLSLAIYIIVRWRAKKKRGAKYFLDTQGILFLICAFWWLLMQKFLIAGICVFFGLIYKLSMKSAKFIFTPGEIVLYSPFKKRFSWHSFVNVILKDGFLTMDFKNNKFIQVPVEDVTEMDETEINAFFRNNLPGEEFV